MKHVTGLENDSGTCIASTALSRVHDRMSGVVWSEQIRIKAVSICESFAVRLQVPEAPSKACAISHTCSHFAQMKLDKRPDCRKIPVLAKTWLAGLCGLLPC
jgi:hypothetical protein